MVWWQWLALGLVLVALEMAASRGVYILFFCLAGIVLAGLRVAGFCATDRD